MNSGVRRPESKSYQRRISVATLVISPLCFHYLPGRNPLTIDSYKNVCNYSDVLAPFYPALLAIKFLFSRSRFLTNEE